MDYPDVTHNWYAFASGALGTFANIELYFNSLKLFGTGRGYYPEPSKSVLILHPDHLEAGKSSACVTCLRCDLVCITLAVLLRIKGPNVIG